MKVKELSEMTLQELWQLFPIVLSEHNSCWAQWYEEECLNLKDILKDINLYRISHFGSTAINNIWAKPTVDILVEIVNASDMNVVKDILLNSGYLCMSQTDTQITINKGYTKYGYAERVFHIHIRTAGDNDELYFRDYMNDNEQLSTEYEKLKLLLSIKYQHDRDGYTNAKSDFIKKYTDEAKKLYLNKYAVNN